MLDKTVQLYKSSTLGQVTSGRSTPARGFSFDVTRPQEPRVSTKDGKEAWATDPDSSLPESEYISINAVIISLGSPVN